MKLKSLIIVNIIVAAGISLSAKNINPDVESDAYPKGYYNGSTLPEKTVYLTFDDGPGEWTEEILNILKKKNVKATFFICAYWGDPKMKRPSSFHRHKAQLQRMVNEGHVIGNHTSGHRVFTGLSQYTLTRQLGHNQEILNNVLGAGAPLMTIIRPPLGLPWSGKSSKIKKEAVGRVIRKIGIVSMWTKKFNSSDSNDWARGEWYKPGRRIDEKNPSFIKKMNRIYNKTAVNANGEGMVVLMHDTHLATVDVLSSVITGLKKKGYKFATMEDFVKWKYGMGSRELIQMENKTLPPVH